MFLSLAILTLSSALGSSVADGWEEVVVKAAKQVGVDPTTLLAICYVESSGKPNATNTKEVKGGPSHGLCQIQEGTARWLGFTGSVVGLYAIANNSTYSARFYAYCVRSFRDKRLAIACYNAGVQGVRNCLKTQGRICNERYVQKVEAVINERYAKDHSGNARRKVVTR